MTRDAREACIACTATSVAVLNSRGIIAVMHIYIEALYNPLNNTGDFTLIYL